MSGVGSWCQIMGGGQDSVGGIQVPITYLCDHSFSKSMAVCASGGGCVPVEMSFASQSAMYAEMTGVPVLLSLSETPPPPRKGHVTVLTWKLSSPQIST
jgi:hypothetical protein